MVKESQPLAKVVWEQEPYFLQLYMACRSGDIGPVCPAKTNLCHLYQHSVHSNICPETPFLMVILILKVAIKQAWNLHYTYSAV